RFRCKRVASRSTSNKFLHPPAASSFPRPPSNTLRSAVDRRRATCLSDRVPADWFSSPKCTIFLCLLRGKRDQLSIPGICDHLFARRRTSTVDQYSRLLNDALVPLTHILSI